jgi:toxin-antitoxin system PIN domain toxin
VLLCDVNVLVYAHREDAVDHKRYRDWLEGLVGGREPYGLADLVLSGFVRVVTHPSVFDPPSSPAQAWAFVRDIRDRPNRVTIAPGSRHWQVFADLCQQTPAKGNLVPDAYLAALAIESGSEFVTTDRGFARFPGLRLRHPLD